MTSKETATQIRRNLKAKGWNSRRVSVRIEWLTYDAAIRVTIRDPAVPKAEVEAIANLHESIDRDHMTGEILSGGNCYVSVEYSAEALAPMVEEITAKLSDEPGQIVEVGPYKVFRTDEPGGPYYRTINIDDRCPLYCWGKNFMARQLAEAVLT